MTFKYKQAIVLRKDIKMSCGKACVHAAHASVEALYFATPDIIKEWESEGYPKVALAANSETEIMDLEYACMETFEVLPCAVIRDLGLTQLDPGTVTAIGIGPAPVEDINKLVGHLKLY